MISFLKVFLRGIICTVLLPLILLVWVCYGVYCLVIFLIMLVKSVICFFAGDNATGEMKEDIEAKRILLEKEQAQIDTNTMLNAMYMNTLNQMQAQAYGQPMPQPAPQQPIYPQPAPQQPIYPQPAPAPQPQPVQFEQQVNQNPANSEQAENIEEDNNNGQSY